ncbi:hypothetical protein K4L06_21820 [Lysobacter sp. BMK333-48F3]|uniref:hypothetical protein n=1 Tax=Lysobacter sp. BMK333-48F3 TaxID=2867962 RepID=UPI001C8C1992|nr:hypothetical protein [Lysobacter sp. BMK333-48F3]MBX9403947.1 hypothetical protein [Lysobacter sp. BMK333-48F3]
MSGDKDEDKRWYTRVPAISIALVAFLVALTTLVNNVREIGGFKDKPAAAPAPAAQPASAPAVAADKPQAPSRYTVLLTLQRIEVVNDGTNGSTAWTFDVEAGGEDLFELPARDYSDAEDARIASPRTSDPSMGQVVLVPGQEMPVKIDGRSAGLILKAHASGSAVLRAGQSLPPVRVLAGENGRDGEFIFHFATTTTPQ